MYSKRLTYHRYTDDDFEKYAALVAENDDLIRSFGRALRKGEVQERFDNILNDNSRFKDLGWYVVKSKETGFHVGLAKIIYEKDNQAEIGYSLLKKYWGQGYGTEIGSHLTTYGRSISRLQNLFGIIDPKNEPSKKILLKCGFEYNCKGNWYDFPGEKYVLDLRS